MAFKEILRLSTWKVIVSLLVGFLVPYFFSWTVVLGSGWSPVSPLTYLSFFFTDFIPFGLILLISSVVVAGIVYLGWSMVRKK